MTGTNRDETNFTKRNDYNWKQQVEVEHQKARLHQLFNSLDCSFPQKFTNNWTQEQLRAPVLWKQLLKSRGLFRIGMHLYKGTKTHHYNLPLVLTSWKNFQNITYAAFEIQSHSLQVLWTQFSGVCKVYWNYKIELDKFLYVLQPTGCKYGFQI